MGYKVQLTNGVLPLLSVVVGSLHVNTTLILLNKLTRQ